ncbi:Syntaxin 16B [Monocercomonoides exilis]|uniref:Syntaxin 16B n=1 Tax=Monocercomonoides exilis TaxID=2049356 RepID=UPI003559638C|nr:Syntaxin 16B [Monocercomonoides exilis]|eukprot:MONOS_11261.1-p1 / transcript=MONOS_11261.1 / gene=MONOS_11261 / organism=Monocercomonoides_exilis_PA203 / gene_product= Syntaxin 16B / transcript_product= Syntaxin 16B / location=Mono_scaffold00555:19421-20712(-) / protein_length=319 / sequence_SO=supercontig / SO=protein_coding / is_pseudo=false
MVERDLTFQFVDMRRRFNESSFRGVDIDSWEADTQELLFKERQWVTSESSYEMELAAIQKEISAVGKLIEQLHTKCSESLVVKSFDAEPTSSHEIEVLSDQVLVRLNSLNQKVSRLFPKEWNDYPQRIDGVIVYPNGENETSFKIRRNMQSSLAERVLTLSQSFRKSRKLYMERMGMIKSQGSSSSSSALSLFDVSEDNEFDPAVYQRSFTEEQEQHMSYSTQRVSQRTEDIRAIARSMNEISVLFNDLSVMVVEQGTLLDNVEHNLSTASEHIKEGTKNVEQAEVIQKKGLRLNRVILILVIAIAVIFAIILIKAFL